MTVAELIQKLQELPGDRDLLTVRLDVTVSRPYATDQRMDCSVYSVGRELAMCIIRGFGFLE